MELLERQGAGERPDAARLVGVHTRLNRVIGELLDLVIEFDTDEARRANGVTDLASWLQFDLGVAPKTARAWVRAARALVHLPLISEAFRSGALSFDEVAVLCRYATLDNQSDLLRLTRHTPVDELSAAVRHHLAMDKPKARGVSKPSMQMWWDAESLQLRGSIPAADGVLMETALLRLASKAPLDPDTGLFRDPDERYGEALVQMASESLADERDHDRATVVVHVNLDALSAPGATVTVAGRQLGRDELLRLTCDGRVQPALDDPHGVTLGIGRMSRQIPPWLRRIVNKRDRGCRFPGCGRTRWTQIHHRKHWADGGPTNLDNLITLCGFHHRLVHNQGWVLEGNPNGELRFINRWGGRHVPARPQFPLDHQDRLVEYLEHYTGHRLGLLAAANSPP